MGTDKTKEEGQGPEEEMGSSNGESRPEGEVEVQVAPIGRVKGRVIPLDVGILMGSQCDEIWEEQADLYPGVKEIIATLQKTPCRCGERGCTRRAFQYILGAASGDDREKACKFIEEASKLTEPDDLKTLMERYYYGYEPQAEDFSLFGDFGGGHKLN